MTEQPKSPPAPPQPQRRIPLKLLLAAARQEGKPLTLNFPSGPMVLDPKELDELDDE
jgi:hypothetical protein